MILKYENLLQELKRFPNLKSAVEFFYQNNGESEHEGCLPNLIVWIRCVLPEDYDAAEYFDMPDEMKEDFWSWGHNSRWANTFYCYLEDNFNYCVKKCLDLAEEYGDFDVEAYMNKKEDQ